MAVFRYSYFINDYHVLHKYIVTPPYIFNDDIDCAFIFTNNKNINHNYFDKYKPCKNSWLIQKTNRNVPNTYSIYDDLLKFCKDNSYTKILVHNADQNIVNNFNNDLWDAINYYIDYNQTPIYSLSVSFPVGLYISKSTSLIKNAMIIKPNLCKLHNINNITTFSHFSTPIFFNNKKTNFTLSVYNLIGIYRSYKSFVRNFKLGYIYFNRLNRIIYMFLLLLLKKS